MHFPHEAGADNCGFDSLHEFSSPANLQHGKNSGARTREFLVGYESTLAMVVRIRWSRPAEVVRPAQQLHQLDSVRGLRLETIALITAALLTPSALVAFTMGLWIITSDLKWTREFFVPQGLFSHWQVWICTAGVLLLLARLLDRLGTVEQKAT
jgi:hypothetical protein